jgi:antitoxin MazE
MRVQIQKWGNSLAVRIPKSFAVETNIHQGSTVEVSIEEDSIVLRPSDDVLTLDDMLADISEENLHTEIYFGKRRGNEIW